MNKKKYILILFSIVVLAQLFVPAKMIYDKEDTIRTGKEFKFKTEPIDPNDPFRGKYITLRFEENFAYVDKTEEWETGELVYVTLFVNDSGYAKIESASKEEPSSDKDYIKAKVYRDYQNSSRINIDFPFKRFYMEESKAYDAELAYREASRKLNNDTYAIVKVKQGQSALLGVFIGSESIVEIARRRKTQSR